MNNEISLKVEFKDFQDLEENSYICESCGNKLQQHSCKLKCSKCGYFRSCSDLF